MPVRHERAFGVYHYLAPAVLTTSSINGQERYARINDAVERRGLRRVTIPGPVVTHGPVPGMWACLAPGRLRDALSVGERLLSGHGLEFVPRSVHWLTGPANETYALVVEFRAPWIDYALYSFRQYQDMAARGVVMPGRVGALVYGDISLQDTEAEMVNSYVEATADLLRGPVFGEVLGHLESWVQQAGAARIYGDSRTFSPETLYAVARETLQQAGYATTNEGFSKDLAAQGGGGPA